MINVRHKSKDRAECGNYRGILLVVHAGKVILEIVATRLSAYCEAKELLLEEQCRSHPVRHRSITDKIFAVRRPQEFGRKGRVPRFLCFIDLEDIRLYRSHTCFASGRSRSTTADGRSNPPILPWDESLCAE